MEFRIEPMEVAASESTSSSHSRPLSAEEEPVKLLQSAEEEAPSRSSFLKVLMRSRSSFFNSRTEMEVAASVSTSSSHSRPLSAEEEPVKLLQQQNALLQHQLESAKQQIVQLQKQLQDVKLHCQAQNADVCSQNDRLRLMVSDLQAHLLTIPPNSATPLQSTCSAGIVSGKNRRDEQYLRELFNRHKDCSGG